MIQQQVGKGARARRALIRRAGSRHRRRFHTDLIQTGTSSLAGMKRGMDAAIGEVEPLHGSGHCFAPTPLVGPRQTRAEGLAPSMSIRFSDSLVLADGELNGCIRIERQPRNQAYISVRAFDSDLSILADFDWSVIDFKNCVRAVQFRTTNAGLTIVDGTP